MRATGPGQSTLLLLDVIDVLNALDVPYAIIGAFAASFYGVVRASVDADAVISLQPGREQAKALLEALQQAGLTSSYTKGDLGDPIGAVINIDDRFGNRVDLLMRIRGMAEATFSRAVEVDFMNARIRIIGIEDFIALKIFAGSQKDLSDVSGVLQVSSKRIHLPLLNELIQPYGKDAVRRLASLLQEHRS